MSDRLSLIPLLGLAMIAPDLLRFAPPLSSFGFYAYNDGLVYDVTGPFAAGASSPAWQAGLPEGDRIDLSRLKCSLKDVAACAPCNWFARSPARACGGERAAGAGADHA
jgi:hypothetical protein